jgi:hypothetical protein
MTDPPPDLFANLDASLLPPVDSQVPFEYRDLPDDFWIRPVVVVKVTGGRL